jgi:hypothetical protein
MNRASTVRQQLVLWGWILGLWLLLILAFSGQLVFAGETTWAQALFIASRDWVPWLVLAPLVAWLGFRFPFDRDRLFLSIPVHLVVCMLTLPLCDYVVRQLPRPFRPPPAAGYGPGRSLRLGPGGIGESPVPPHVPRPPAPGSANQVPPVPERVPSPPFLVHQLVQVSRFNLPVYWVIVSIAQAMRFYRRSQERERQAAELEGRLAQAKLHALRMQLHPHFLFNTLNAISTLVHKDPNAADEMIGNLSELLRATLETASQEIPLRQELEFLDRYLEIQQVRFGPRLRVVKQVDPTTLEQRVPALILQPLVENSLRHGIEPKPGGGTVTITTRPEGQRLHLVIEDDGKGAVADAKPERGIGLSNTRARLQELYGNQAQLSLHSRPGEGFTAEVVLPLRLQAPHS